MVTTAIKRPGSFEIAGTISLARRSSEMESSLGMIRGVEDDVGVLVGPVTMRNRGREPTGVAANAAYGAWTSGRLALHQRIVGVQRSGHADDGETKLRLQSLLDGVDDVVQFVHVAVRGHLCVQGDHEVARAVFVDDQVVYADDLPVFLDDGADVAHQLRVRRAAEQRRDGVLCRVCSRPRG